MEDGKQKRNYLETMNIYHLLPELNNENHNITSDPTEEYNCVAWGLGEGEMGGDNTTWWEPTPGYYSRKKPFQKILI